MRRGGIYPSRGVDGSRTLPRSGQDRSLQITRERHTVGRGLDPSVRVSGHASIPGGINPSPRLSKKVRSPLSPLCEGAPPAGGGGENCTAFRNISGYGKVLSLRPFGAPPSQREVFRHAAGGINPSPTTFPYTSCRPWLKCTLCPAAIRVKTSKKYL